MSAVVQPTFFFSFIQGPAHVIVCVLPSFGVDLSMSVSEIKIIPFKHHNSPLFILDYAKLTIKNEL